MRLSEEILAGSQRPRVRDLDEAIVCERHLLRADRGFFSRSPANIERVKSSWSGHV